MRIFADHSCKVVHNPESNMKLASGVAPVPEMIKAGVTVGLGTDGCASNNNLDMFQEMDTAAKLHKVAKLDPTVMDAKTVVRMATCEGAKALGMENIVGSLKAGMKADIIVINLNKPHLTPLYNEYSHIVYAVNGADVDTVLINGNVVMKNRKLLTIDEEEILAMVEETAIRIKKQFGIELAMSDTKDNNQFDIIIEGGTLLTMSETMDVIDNPVIGIKDGKIAFIKHGDIDGGHSFTAKKVLSAHGSIIMPGLINTHTHLPMVCFRGLADDLPLMDWLHNHIFPAESKFVTREMVYRGAMLAIAEMILSGTTTFCDAYFYESEVARAAFDSGMRAVVSQGFIDFPASTAPEKIADIAERFISKWQIKISVDYPRSCLSLTLCLFPGNSHERKGRRTEGRCTIQHTRIGDKR